MTKDGATPLLFGEVKAGGSYEVNIGQPLACALELMMMSTAKPESMWWVPCLYILFSPGLLARCRDACSVHPCTAPCCT